MAYTRKTSHTSATNSDTARYTSKVATAIPDSVGKRNKTDFCTSEKISVCSYQIYNMLLEAACTVSSSTHTGILILVGGLLVDILYSKVPKFRFGGLISDFCKMSARKLSQVTSLRSIEDCKGKFQEAAAIIIECKK